MLNALCNTIKLSICSFLLSLSMVYLYILCAISHFLSPSFPHIHSIVPLVQSFKWDFVIASQQPLYVCVIHIQCPVQFVYEHLKKTTKWWISIFKAKFTLICFHFWTMNFHLSLAVFVSNSFLFCWLVLLLFFYI